MEGNIFVLFVAIILGSLFALSIVLYQISKWSTPAPKKNRTRRSSSAAARFIREDYVKGRLLIDGHEIPTYNPGTLVFAETVSMTFQSNFNSPVRITDIEMNGISIYSFSDAGTSLRDKADYAIQVLKQSANQGAIDRSIVNAVEQTIHDVDALNMLIKEGAVYQLPGEYNQDFAWRG